MAELGFSKGEYEPSPNPFDWEKDTLHFFESRLACSFPGVHGLKWFNTPHVAVDLLLRLLSQPLTFSLPDAYYHPIWWFRGPYNNPVQRVAKLTSTKLLLDEHELEVERVAVYRQTPSRSFVYVETSRESAVHPEYDEPSYIARALGRSGFAREEYALLGHRPITRDEYDDGHADLDGQVVSAANAEFRIRYLTPYSFLLAAQFSPLKSLSEKPSRTERRPVH